MIGNFQLLHQILRYSILSVLIVPIYVFSTKGYDTENGNFKIALSSLSIFVVITTLFYWKKVEYKGKVWKFLDRLTVLAILIILLYSGNKEVRGFVLLGVLFYILASTEKKPFQESDSYLNHMLFRYFAGVGLIIYSAGQPYKGVNYDEIFIGLSSFFYNFMSLHIS